MFQNLILFTILSFCSCSCSWVYSLNSNTVDKTLDATLQESAFKALIRHRPHTGALYKAILPANLSGMEVSIVRLRSRRLYKIGAKFNNFRIPSRTISVPHVKRLAIVYQDFGNWSSHYFTIRTGYSFLTSVVGFMIFDASMVQGVRKINLSLMEKNPISIHFPNLTFSDNEMISRDGCSCLGFDKNGSFYFSDLSLPNVCYTLEEGHFSIVCRLKSKQKKDVFTWVMIGFVVGLCVMILVGYLGIRVLKTKKIQSMEKQADQGAVFHGRWIGSSKMPSATVTRTQPVLENGGFL